MKTQMTILLCLLTSIIFSQEKNEDFLIEKGLWSIEGEFSINSINSDYPNDIGNIAREDFNFNIAPKVGYIISDNLILGLGIGYSYLKTEFENENSNDLNINDSKTNSIEFFPYIKKFFPVSKKLALHLQGETRFTFRKNTFINYYNDERVNNSELLFIGIRPGISYNMSKNILLQANVGSLGYQHASSEVDDVETEKSNSFGFNFNTSNLTFGLTILL
ncbi:porin family protein [Winogradskyella helgolandensis]|uniref:outer membrane beta-barrel protein n=1 Tax=Winogradskyella helgolandensis TaxID=2697010 RepID=UPI0015B8A454|nr:outer membrane beta-barrel protein [Winogradskyella helgolandensis]